MYRVALVDDEDIFVQYLSGAVDWERFHCTLCGTASDGVEALELIQEQKPHILFLDINMSVMNGLDVCDTIQDWPDAPHVIILSAHGEFSYAQQAIRLGVFSYLLKPFNEDELEDTLLKCISSIQQEEQQRLLQQSGEDAAVAEYLRNLLAGHQPEQSAPEQLQKADYYTVAMLKCAVAEEAPLEALLRSLKEYFGGLGVDSFLVERRGDTVGIVHSIRSDTINLNTFQRHYSTWMQGEDGPDCECVSIGSMAKTLAELSSSHSEAVTGMENRINVDKNVVISRDLAHLESHKGAYTPADVQLLIRCFDAGEYEKADGVIEKIFAISHNHVMSFQYVVSTYYAIVIAIYIHYGKTEYDMNNYLALQNQIVAELGTCNNTGEMVAIIKNYIHEVFSDCIAFSASGSNNTLVQKIRSYLQRHYGDAELTVERIAQALFFENSYIRRVYKSHTGRTIAQQLEEIRMEKAKELIEQDECRISEVARLTGFSDQFYFSRRFKLVTNMTPTEYKNFAARSKSSE